jgi:hypothetical protein
MQPWSLHRFEGVPGKWRCTVQDVATKVALTLHAPIGIDAHGSWESLPSDRSQRSCNANDLLAFKANFVGASPLSGLLPVLSFEGGYGGMVIADKGVLTLACCVRRDRLAQMRRVSPGIAAGEVVEIMLRQSCAGVDAALLPARRVGPWLAAGPLRPGTRLRADDAVFRIGNAAAEAHPIIGEGMSMAFQSAWLLCTHLTCTGATPPMTDRKWQRSVGTGYAKDWHREFDHRLQLASAFAHAAMRPSFASLLMTLVRVWPGLLPLGATWGGKTRFIKTSSQPPGDARYDYHL